MNFWFLMMGAGLSLVSALLHGVFGGQLYMENINSSAMEPLTKSLSLVSWHVFTIFLVVCACSLGYIAYNPVFSTAAYPLIAINLLGAVLFVVLGITNHGVLLRMPGAYLMGGTAVLVWLGIS